MASPDTDVAALKKLLAGLSRSVETTDGSSTMSILYRDSFIAAGCLPHLVRMLQSASAATSPGGRVSTHQQEVSELAAGVLRNLVAGHATVKSAVAAAASGVLPALVRALAGGKSALLQSRAAAALGNIVGGRGGPDVTDCCRFAVTASGAIPHLARLSRSPHEGVKREAAKALTRLRQP